MLRAVRVEEKVLDDFFEDSSPDILFLVSLSSELITMTVSGFGLSITFLCSAATFLTAPLFPTAFPLAASTAFTTSVIGFCKYKDFQLGVRTDKNEKDIRREWKIFISYLSLRSSFSHKITNILKNSSAPSIS